MALLGPSRKGLPSRAHEQQHGIQSSHPRTSCCQIVAARTPHKHSLRKALTVSHLANSTAMTTQTTEIGVSVAWPNSSEPQTSAKHRKSKRCEPLSRAEPPLCLPRQTGTRLITVLSIRSRLLQRLRWHRRRWHLVAGATPRRHCQNKGQRRSAAVQRYQIGTIGCVPMAASLAIFRYHAHPIHRYPKLATCVQCLALGGLGRK